ncbi:MAG: hypothetical protein V3V64_03545 [Acidiferrobacterales bacterium]
MSPRPGAGLVLGAHGLPPCCQLGGAITTRLVLSPRSRVVDHHAMLALLGSRLSSETP